MLDELLKKLNYLHKIPDNIAQFKIYVLKADVRRSAERSARFLVDSLAVHETPLTGEGVGVHVVEQPGSNLLRVEGLRQLKG